MEARSDGGGEPALPSEIPTYSSEAAIISATFDRVCSDGDEMTTERFLDVIANSLRTFGVKAEPEEQCSVLPSTELLEVDRLRQTHDSIAPRFRNGASFEKLVAQLNEGMHNTETAPFLKLDVMRWPATPEDRYFSLSNRRLFCLQRHQEHVRATKGKIKVCCRVWSLPPSFTQLMQNPTFHRFVRSYSSLNGGKSVRVRRESVTSGAELSRRMRKAADQGDFAAVATLLNSRAQVDHQDRGGKTAIHYAAASGSTSVVKVLLRHGADPSADDFHGSRPLREAAHWYVRGKPETRSRLEETIRLLRRHGAEWNPDDLSRRRLLEREAQGRGLELLAELLAEAPAEGAAEAADRDPWA